MIINKGVAMRLNKIQITTFRFRFCAITATMTYKPIDMPMKNSRMLIAIIR